MDFLFSWSLLLENQDLFQLPVLIRFLVIPFICWLTIQPFCYAVSVPTICFKKICFIYIRVLNFLRLFFDRICFHYFETFLLDFLDPISLPFDSRFLSQYFFGLFLLVKLFVFSSAVVFYHFLSFHCVLVCFLFVSIFGVSSRFQFPSCLFFYLGYFMGWVVC